jgi:O-antigen ligase
MDWIGLVLIGLTLLVFMGGTKRGIVLWSWLSSPMDFFHVSFLAGFPAFTLSLFTLLPGFFSHFFTGQLLRAWHRVPRSLLMPMILMVTVFFFEFWRTDALLTQAAQDYLHRDVLPLMLFLMILTTDWRERDLDRLARGLVLSFVVVAIVAIAETVTQVPLLFSVDDHALAEFPHRPTGTFTTIAGMNTVLSMGFLFLAPYISRWKGFWGLVGRFGILMTLTANVLAFYRGTLIPMGGLFLIWLWREPRRRVATSVALVALVIPLLVYQGALRESDIYTKRISVSVDSRIATYIQSVKVISDQVLVGYGFKNATDAMGSMSPSYFKGSESKPTPHNSYFQVFLEAGLIGFGTLAFWFTALYRVMRNRFRDCAARERDFMFSGVLILLQFLLLNLSLTSYSGTSATALYAFLALVLVRTHLVRDEEEPALS